MERRLLTIIYALYALGGIAGAIWHAATGDVLYCISSLGTLMWFPIRFALIRLMRGKRVIRLEIFVALFLFLSYTLGVAMEFYVFVPYYDKAVHTLCGTLVITLSIPFFYALKHGHAIERTDGALAVAFGILSALAVAAAWEMIEYTLDLTLGTGIQRVSETGVADTMQDMMVCFVGALAAVPSIRRFYLRGRRGFLMGAALSFPETMYVP
jgi:uncharacterized membrane protein YjdF